MEPAFGYFSWLLIPQPSTIDHRQYTADRTGGVWGCKRALDVVCNRQTVIEQRRVQSARIAVKADRAEKPSPRMSSGSVLDPVSVHPPHVCLLVVISRGFSIVRGLRKLRLELTRRSFPILIYSGLSALATSRGTCGGRLDAVPAPVRLLGDRIRLENAISSDDIMD